jgi:hypothetical protein
MTQHDLLALIEEGLDNGRISPHLAAFIAGDVLGVDALETDYADVVPSPEVVES